MKRKWIFWLWVLALGHAASAWPGDWSVTPKIDLRTMHDSNVLYTHTDEVNDWIAFISPSLTATYRLERTQFALDTELNGQIYAEHSDFNSVDLSSKAAVMHQWSPRLSSRLQLLFRRDETLETELAEAGYLARRETRYRYGPEISAAYMLSERYGIETSAAFLRGEYDRYPNQSFLSGTVSPYRLLTPRDRLGLSISATYGDYENNTTIGTLAPSIFWRRDLTECLLFSAHFGYRITETSRERQAFRIIVDPESGFFQIVPVSEEESSTDEGFIFGITIDGKFTEISSGRLTAGREQYNTVAAESSLRTYVRGEIRHLLAENLIGVLAGSYDTFDYGSHGGDGQNEYFRLAPSVVLRLRKPLLLTVGASFEKALSESSGGDRNRERYRQWIGMSYSWERLLKK